MKGQSFTVTEERRRRSARWCFRAALTLATGLAVLVLAAPWAAVHWPHAAPHWLTLFAEDLVVRRVVVIAAVGLWLTALVWFRGPTAAKSLEQAP